MVRSEYFDLTDSLNDIENLAIFKVDYFDCRLTDTTTGQIYEGFILAQSKEGNRLTVCDVGFRKSATDQKYQPRLVFRRTKANLDNVVPPKTAENIRLSFATGDDGYRNFWKMIFFLYGFKEIIDFGDFDSSYQVFSSDQLKKYMNDQNNKVEMLKVLEELDIDISVILRSQSTLILLRKYKEKLQEFIDNDSTETDVQNWLDEENHKYRQQRCLIFGLEYIDFHREGSVSSKNFDVLTRIGSKHVDHVLIELKSPADDIFKITPHTTINEQTNTYQLHEHLSRAIPQILEYKSILEAKQPGDPELEKLGITNKAHIGKCIIVIGKHQDDARWIQNRKNLLHSLGAVLEIWTYTELLDKLTSTIESLERIKEEENYEKDQYDF